MARTDALIDRNQAVFSAAVLAAEATGRDQGFRQRDVRFFVELFSNWQGPSLGPITAVIHNTQIQRQLEAFTALKWTRSVGRRPPRFRLGAQGMLGLLRQLALSSTPRRHEEVFFAFHFLDVYGGRLRAMAEQAPFDVTLLAVDLAELLDPKRLLARERKRLAVEIARVDTRADEALATGQLARKLFAKKLPLERVIGDVEAKYPYELNSQKPLRELLALLPEAWRHDELTTIAERRASQLWSSQRSLLMAYDHILQTLTR